MAAPPPAAAGNAVTAARVLFGLTLLLLPGMARAAVEAASRMPPSSAGIRLQVDATDTDRRIFHVRETIAVRVPGTVTLLYPEWETASRVSVVPMAGLVVRASGRRDWAAPAGGRCMSRS